jgi:hypothetical protein
MAVLTSSRVTAALAFCAALAAADPSSDAAAACSSLNITRQLELMRGFGPIAGYSRNSGCADVCGRFTFRWDNGPQGFGDGSRPGSTTQWSSSLAAAATWDPELIFRWGTAMGEEFWSKGTNIQEGPGVNVARVQHNGRCVVARARSAGGGGVLGRPAPPASPRPPPPVPQEL